MPAAAASGRSRLADVSLATAPKDEPYREPALVTFLVTLSGVELLGVGSAFWGVVGGAIALFVQQWRPRRDEARLPKP